MLTLTLYRKLWANTGKTLFSLRDVKATGSSPVAPINLPLQNENILDFVKLLII
jgi:hypothetical protein